MAQAHRTRPQGPACGRGSRTAYTQGPENSSAYNRGAVVITSEPDLGTTIHFTVDTSVAAKLYLDDEEFTDQTVALFAGYANGSVDLVAPFLIYYELPKAILQACFRRRIDPRRAAEAIDAFYALALPTVGAGEGIARNMVKDAFEIAVRYRCSIYDAVFLRLAEALQAPLITADARLYNSVRGKINHVVWIGDYSPNT